MTAQYLLPDSVLDTFAELDRQAQKELDKERQRVEELESALRFYANVDHYTYGVLSLSASKIQMDNGERARIALFESEVE